MSNLPSFVKRRKFEESESKWLLIRDAEESESTDFFEGIENTDNTDQTKNERNHPTSFSQDQKGQKNSALSSINAADHNGNSSQKQFQRDGSGSSTAATSRRNAICDVIEKQTYSDSGKKSLRKDREDLLRVIALSNYSLL